MRSVFKKLVIPVVIILGSLRCSPVIADSSESNTPLQSAPPGAFSSIEWTSCTRVQEEFDEFMMKEQLDNCSRELLFGIRMIANVFYFNYEESIPRAKMALKKILLLGPPGSGKSSLAKTIAYRLRRPYLFITAATICNEFKDSGIGSLQRLTEFLGKSKMPCVVIFDEITSLTDKFKNDNSNIGVIEVFWTMLDKLEKMPHVLFIVTANDIEKLPITLKDRFGKCIYYIPLPAYLCTCAYIKTLLRRMSDF